MLVRRDLAPRGYRHCVEELLRQLPAALKEAKKVHFHGGKANAELRATLKLWFTHVSALLRITPPRAGDPQAADIAILTPRSEVSPVAATLYLLSSVAFTLLMRVDLVAQVRQANLYPNCSHEQIALRLDAAGKITILDAQMIWLVGNVPDCRPIEIFSAQLRTPAPLTGFARPSSSDPADACEDLAEAEGTVPRTLEAWIHAQQADADFPAMLDAIQDKAQRQGLWIYVPPAKPPTILVQQTCWELLVRDTHDRMFHLNSLHQRGS
jgi:hypothetical protein